MARIRHSDFSAPHLRDQPHKYLKFQGFAPTRPAGCGNRGTALGKAPRLYVRETHLLILKRWSEGQRLGCFLGERLEGPICPLSLCLTPARGHHPLTLPLLLSRAPEPPGRGPLCTSAALVYTSGAPGFEAATQGMNTP